MQTCADIIPIIIAVATSISMKRIPIPILGHAALLSVFTRGAFVLAPNLLVVVVFPKHSPRCAVPSVAYPLTHAKGRPVSRYFNYVRLQLQLSSQDSSKTSMPGSRRPQICHRRQNTFRRIVTNGKASTRCLHAHQ